ncbi:hypothetical protein V8C86DRAFT_2840904 [Haematococcus lacustris]
MQSDPDAAMCSALVSLVQSLPLVVHPLMMYTQQEDPATVSALNAAVNCGQQLRALQTVLCCTQLQMHEVERRLACQCPPPPNPPPLTAMLDPCQQPPVAQQLPTSASLNTSPSIRLGQLPSAPCQRQGHCPMPILPVASISNSQTAQQTVNSVMSVMPLQLPPPEQAATHGQAGGYPCPWPASVDRPGANGSSFVHTDLTHQGPAPPSAAAPAAPSPCRSSLQPPSPFGAAPSPTGSPPGGLLPAACPTPPSRHSLRCSSQQRSSLGQQGGVGRGVANSLDQDSQGGAGRDSQSVTPSQRERILEQLLFLTGRESDSGSSRGSSQELEEDEQEGEEGEAAGAEDGDHSSARCSSGGMTAGPTGGTPGGCMGRASMFSAASGAAARRARHAAAKQAARLAKQQPAVVYACHVPLRSKSSAHAHPHAPCLTTLPPCPSPPAASPAPSLHVQRSPLLVRVLGSPWWLLRRALASGAPPGAGPEGPGCSPRPSRRPMYLGDDDTLASSSAGSSGRSSLDSSQGAPGEEGASALHGPHSTPSAAAGGQGGEPGGVAVQAQERCLATVLAPGAVQAGAAARPGAVGPGGCCLVEEQGGELVAWQ